MKPIKSKRTFVDEGLAYGLYVWQMEDGKVLGDSDGNVLNVPSLRGDLDRQLKLRAAVRSLGIEGGEPLFLPGQRRVTDDEYADQMDRMINGQVPDPMDIGALKDEIRGRRAHEGRS